MQDLYLIYMVLLVRRFESDSMSYYFKVIIRLTTLSIKGKIYFLTLHNILKGNRVMKSFLKNLSFTMSDSILMALKHPELFFLLVLENYLILPYALDIQPFLVPIVIAITIIGVDIYFMGNIFTHSKEISRVLWSYILRFLITILVMIFIIYPFISHYAWVSLYRLFKLFGKILYSEDYIIVSLLTVVLCLFICDFIAKLTLSKKKNKIIGNLPGYCIGFFVFFIFLALIVFFTFTKSFSQFEIFKIPAIFLIFILWCILLIWQRLYCLSLNDFVSIDRNLYSYSED